ATPVTLRTDILRGRRVGRGHVPTCTPGNLFRADSRRVHSMSTIEKFGKTFRDLVHTLDHIAIILDAEGNLIYCNDFLLRLTDWREDEVLGLSWCDIFVPPLQYPRELFQTQLAEANIPAHHQNEIITRNVERRLIDWNNTILHDAAGNGI